MLISVSALAHRSGCHRWHSCPSDHGTYVCGDLGYCSGCPDNQYCLNRQPRPVLREVPKESLKQEAPKSVLSVQVVGVVDGDTIQVCCINERREKVRHIGINTPETKHPKKGVEYFGKEASEANRKLVEGNTVRLEMDVQQRDRYGRVLAYVYLEDGTFVNAWLVEHGFAQVMTIPPNVRYQDLFLELQQEAREAKRGLWR
ncbi:MAG: thermonuclease family protein [Candidatus Methylomirabilales bacterium]